MKDACFRPTGALSSIRKERKRKLKGRRKENPEDLLINTNHIGSRLIPPSPVSDACGVFINGDLALSTEKQTRAMAYAVQGLFRLSQPTIPKELSRAQYWEFC